MLGMTLNPGEFLRRVGDELARVDARACVQLAELIADRWRTGRCVFVIGNGGSGSNASHFATDLCKGSIPKHRLDDERQRRLRAISLTDHSPTLLAWGNDAGFDRVFVEQLRNLAQPGDLLIAISGSGNSPNVLHAVEWANSHELTTFACTGFDGGKLRPLAQHALHVDLHDMEVVESIHNTVFHWVVDHLRVRFNA